MIVLRRDAAGEERAELGAGQFDAGVDDGLQQRRQVELGIELGSSAIQDAEHTLLLQQREPRALLLGHVGGDRDDADQLTVLRL